MCLGLQIPIATWTAFGKLDVGTPEAEAFRRCYNYLLYAACDPQEFSEILLSKGIITSETRDSIALYRDEVHPKEVILDAIQCAIAQCSDKIGYCQVYSQRWKKAVSLNIALIGWRISLPVSKFLIKLYSVIKLMKSVCVGGSRVLYHRHFKPDSFICIVQYIQFILCCYF